MRLAICGPKGSGKTTIARYMAEEHGWLHIDYTGLLKSWLVEAVNDCREQRDFTLEELVESKEKYRHLLQQWGELVGFDNGNGVEESLIPMLNEPKRHIIFDNVRFQAQFDILDDYGFVLGRLETVRRAYSPAEADGHPAEHQVLRPDIIINADRTVDEIALVLLRLAEPNRHVYASAA